MLLLLLRGARFKRRKLLRGRGAGGGGRRRWRRGEFGRSFRRRRRRFLVLARRHGRSAGRTRSSRAGKWTRLAGRGRGRGGTDSEDLVEILDEMLDDDVAEFDIHDGSHSFLLAPQQRRSETDSQVGLVHEIGVAGIGHFDQMSDQSE